MPDLQLLDAIRRLTLPHKTRVVQTSDAGVACVSTVHHRPLLEMLKEAIGGNVGRHASSTPAREKMPINAAALEKFDEIAAQVAKWSTHLAPVGYQELWSAVARWHLDFENRRRSGQISDSAATVYERIVFGWEYQIDSMFDPPHVFEVTKIVGGREVDGEIVGGRNVPVACPICKNSKAIDPKSGDQVSAVVIEYRGDLLPDLSNATGMCRRCGEMWHGGSGARTLRWLLDQEAEDLTPDELAIVARFGLDRPEHPDFDDPDFADAPAAQAFLNIDTPKGTR